MPNKTKPLRVLVVGCGNMGASHALAYHKMDGHGDMWPCLPWKK